MSTQILTKSILDKILYAVESRVSALGLTDPWVEDGVCNNKPIPVVRRMLPRRTEVLDPPTQITVSPPDAPDKTIYYGFGSVVYVYTIIITVVSPNNQDITTPITPYTQMRERIKDAFSSFQSYPVLNVPGCFDMRVEMYTLFNRGMLAQNYNYQSIALQITGG